MQICMYTNVATPAYIVGKHIYIIVYTFVPIYIATLKFGTYVAMYVYNTASNT